MALQGGTSVSVSLCACILCLRKYNLVPPNEKVSSSIQKIHIHPGICFPLIHSVLSDDSVSGQRRP